VWDSVREDLTDSFVFMSDDLCLLDAHCASGTGVIGALAASACHAQHILF
jgi:hypothetical protein